MKIKLKLSLFILTAFSNMVFSEEAVWSKNKTAHFSNTDWHYEHGQILTDKIPIANYVLQERIHPRAKTGEKKADYFMTVTFSNDNPDSYVVLKGTHHLTDKNYDGWVIAASEDQSALIDSTVSANEKTKQWRLKKATEDEIVLKMASQQFGVAADSLQINYRCQAHDSYKHTGIRSFGISSKEGIYDNYYSEWIYLFPNRQRVPGEFIGILSEWEILKFPDTITPAVICHDDLIITILPESVTSFASH